MFRIARIVSFLPLVSLFAAVATAGPTLIVPDDFTVEARSSAGSHVSFNVVSTGLPIGEDDRGRPVNAICAPPSGSLFPIGATTVSCYAIDLTGTTVRTFRITVRDSEAPALNLPASVATTTTGSSAIVTFSATAEDAINGVVPVTCTPASGSTFATGVTFVTCSASDASGNTATGTFTVTVTGSTPPTLVLLDVTSEATGPSGANVSYEGLGDGSDYVFTCSPTSGSFFPLGTTPVQCTATDGSTTLTGSFDVNVVDTTPPVVSVPTSITVEAASSAGAIATFTAAATDIVDGALATTCAPPSGSTFGLGATTVSCSATDTRGNTGVAYFDVTVVDTTPPVLTLPGDLVAAATSAAGAVVTFIATADDLVDGSVAVTCAPPSGSTFPIGTTVVQCSASDTRGNTASGSFSIEVRDVTPPVITSVTVTPEVLWPANHNMVAVTVTVQATDEVDPTPLSRIYFISSNEAVQAPGTGTTTPDWQITDLLDASLRAERAGSGTGRVYTLHIECFDDAGNRSTATVRVTVPRDLGKRRS